MEAHHFQASANWYNATCKVDLVGLLSTDTDLGSNTGGNGWPYDWNIEQYVQKKSKKLNGFCFIAGNFFYF